MKNADEIVKALRICSDNSLECSNCPYYNDRECGRNSLEKDAAALIESLQSQLAETKRRLDAAIKDLGEEMPHWACKNKSKDNCSISAFEGDMTVDIAACGNGAPRRTRKEPQNDRIDGDS